MKTLLSARWIIPIDSPAIEDGAVLIEGDEIKDVGLAEDLNSRWPEAQNRNFGRAVIVPGFVDLHTHLEWSVFRGVCDDLPYTEWKIQQVEKARALNGEDWRTAAKLGAMEAAQSGITTIADLTETGASLEAALDFGLRGMIFFEMTGMDYSKVGRQLEEAQKEIDRWRTLAKGSNIDIGIAPMSPHTACPPLIEGAADLARSEKLKLCMHIAGSRDEYEFVKYGSSELAGAYRDVMGWSDFLWQPTGVTPVKYLLQWGLFDNDVLAAHCVHVNDDDIGILRDHDVAIAHCPRCSAKLGMGTAPLRKFIDAGLRVGLGTDSPASNNTMDFFDEMRIGLLIQRSKNSSVEKASARRYVRMATLGGAEALGMENEIGSLEPGKKADLTVVDMSKSIQQPLTDPYSALVYTAGHADVVLTIGAGKILYEEGRTPAFDEEKIIPEIERIRKKLR